MNIGISISTTNISQYRSEMVLSGLGLGVERVGNFDTGSGMALEEKTDTGSAPGRVCVMTRYN